MKTAFKDEQNRWFATTGYYAGFCVNTDVLKKKNLPMPASWQDLTKPVYKGEIVMPNAASSGTGYLSVASILQRLKEPEGWNYLDALDKNMAEYTKSGSKPCKDAASGERAIGVSFEYVAAKMKKDGAPVEMVLPKEGSYVDLSILGPLSAHPIHRPSPGCSCGRAAGRAARLVEGGGLRYDRTLELPAS